jgi:hypothetical protein
MGTSSFTLLKLRLSASGADCEKSVDERLRLILNLFSSSGEHDKGLGCDGEPAEVDNGPQNAMMCLSCFDRSRNLELASKEIRLDCRLLVGDAFFREEAMVLARKTVDRD